MKKYKNIKSAALCVLLTFAMGSTALAAPNTTLTQTITNGVLSTDILDAARNPVASPAVGMSSKPFAFDCQLAANASSGTLGTNTERVYLINPSGANNGWTLTMAATTGPTTTWSNAGATNKFDFNDPTGSGCTDGADADIKAGQMTVDPSVSTLTTDCSVCTTTGVTKGSSTAYSQGVTDSVTLASAALASDDIWRGYFTGTSLKQVIPAEQPVDTYTINLTLTATAL